MGDKPKIGSGGGSVGKKDDDESMKQKILQKREIFFSFSFHRFKEKLIPPFTLQNYKQRLCTIPGS